MSKNKGDKGKKRAMTEPIKIKGEEKIIEGLSFDINEEAKKNVDSQHAKAPYERAFNEVVEVEINHRAELLKNAMFNEYPKLAEEIESFEPDIKPSYDFEGNEVTPARYSKDSMNQINKATKTFKQLKEAIKAAKDHSDYSKLKSYFNEV